MGGERIKSLFSFLFVLWVVVPNLYVACMLQGEG